MLPKLSVLIATRNRASLLETALETIAAQEDAPAWEAIVVDNGSSDETPELLARLARHLPIVALHEPRPGKSRAMNLALTAASGEFILFTDDDVRPSPRWFAELYAAWRAHPHADVFCGPIIPEFPADTPAWVRTFPFGGPAFSDFRPNLPAGPLPPSWLPFGPNFAVTRQALSGMAFRVDLGPSEPDSLMSEDMEFMEELQRRSKAFFFVPAASVIHCIRRELTMVPVLLERAFALGRSEVIRGKLPELRSRPLAQARSQGGFALGCAVSFLCGQLFEFHARDRREPGRQLIDWIASSSWGAEPGSIARSAEDWLRRTPELRSLLTAQDVSSRESPQNSRA
jgi:GT2 family glycosyltransferase